MAALAPYSGGGVRRRDEDGEQVEMDELKEEETDEDEEEEGEKEVGKKWKKRNRMWRSSGGKRM